MSSSLGEAIHKYLMEQHQRKEEGDILQQKNM